MLYYWLDNSKFKLTLQVHGFVEDVSGKKVATLFGKWNENMYYMNGEWTSKPKDLSDSALLWTRNKPPLNLTRYNLSSFAITLNELTPGLEVQHCVSS